MAKPRVSAATRAHPHDKPHYPHWPLSALLFAAVLALGLLSVHEPGTWIHIKTGARILATRRIPIVDSFSYTVAGRPWTTDSWLADVLFFRVHQVFGPPGLILLKSLALAAGFALLLPLNPASPLTAASVLGLGAVSAWAGFTEMPGVFDFLLLALMIRALRPRRLFHWTMVVNVAALELLWANLHGTTAILGVWLIALKVFKASLRTASRERLYYAGLLAVACAALLCNPHGAAAIRDMFTGLEASSAAWRPISPWFNLYTLFALAGAAACATCLQQEFFLSMTTASLLALGLVVPQLRPLSILACCPTISLALGHYLPPIDDRPAHVGAWAMGMGLLIGFHWLFAFYPLASAKGYGSGPGLAGAMGYVKAHGVTGRMFNEAGAGAALIGLSDRPVFVDERSALYGPSFMSAAARWPELFDELSRVYRFDYAVVLNRRAAYPARILDGDRGWFLAYADDAALVYLNRSGADGRLAGPPALLCPNRLWPESLDGLLADAARRPRLMRELDDWILAAPQALQPVIWKSYALSRAGEGLEGRRLLDMAARDPAVWRDPELLAGLGSAAQAASDPVLAQRCYFHALLLAERRGDGPLVEAIRPRLKLSWGSVASLAD